MGVKQYLKRGFDYLLHGVPINKIETSISYLNPSQRLEGKNIIVTGGGRGLGFAMAKRFVEEGAKVLIAGRSIDHLKESALKIGCDFLQIDVQNVESFDDFFDDASSILGEINCLVNNAGVSHHDLDIFYRKSL